MTTRFKSADISFNAHYLPIESSSVNLMTCAISHPWLDVVFYAEVKKVLKPRGCLRAWSHCVQIKDNEHINNAFNKI